MARDSIDLPDDLIESVVRHIRDEKFSLLAGDPGASGGICFTGSDVVISAQGGVHELVDAMALAGVPRAAVYIREAPYTASKEQMARSSSRATPQTIWAMGHAAGCMDMAMSRFVLPNAPRWFPMPSTWRSVIGLNRKKNADQDARTATNIAVHQWAEATSKRVMRTSTGRPAFDEANAYALNAAARFAINSILRSQR